MPLLGKPLASIAESDLEELIEHGIPEGKTVEHKRVLPGNADACKREFLADVSSFANAAGGHIIYGSWRSVESRRGCVVYPG